jgi:Flp pilus assembly protein TadG
LQRGASWADQRGQAMTELAIVLPVLAIVLFAILQFGITFNNYLTVTDAVRAGARRGAVARHDANPTSVTVQKVRAAAADLDQSKLTVSVSSTWQPGSNLVVTARYPYSINVLGFVVRSGNLTTSTEERVE